jgi:DNA replication protein DnaC
MTELSKQIESQMKFLQLKGLIPLYKKVAQKASEKNLHYEEFLALLLEEEFKRKKESSINARISKAKFPFMKTLEEFDFSFQPNLNEKELISLSGLEFIEKKENIVFLGPPGVGKTHLAIALGILACRAGYRVNFVTTQKLLETLLLAKKDGSFAQKILAFSRLQLLIIDELGYMPISKQHADLLFQLISARYEKGSLIFTSNYNFDEWGSVFDDNVVASAIIDRLVHHCKIFLINGASYRLKNKLKTS